MTREHKYNLTLEEVIPELDSQLVKMRAETDRNQLAGISADEAYEIGYETAIFDLRHFTGPNPLEVQLVSLSVPEVGIK